MQTAERPMKMTKGNISRVKETARVIFSGNSANPGASIPTSRGANTIPATVTANRNSKTHQPIHLRMHKKVK